MAGGYSRHFTLADIFNNKKLADKLPLVNYKERTTGDLKTSRTTSMKTLSAFVYEKSVIAATPFYEPLKAQKSGDIIVLGGNLVGDRNEAVEAVYGALVASKFLMEFTVNNMEMIRSALKEGERTKPAPKLYLKYNSMAQIEGLDKKGLKTLMQDIMENLYYSDDYGKTQEKFGVRNRVINLFSYERNKERWARKVGVL